MKLYMLKRKIHNHNHNNSHIVRAFNSRQARVTASLHDSGASAQDWLEPELTTCRQVKMDGPIEVIHTDYCD